MNVFIKSQQTVTPIIEYHADCYGFGIYLDEDKLEETSDQVLRVTLPSEL